MMSIDSVMLSNHLILCQPLLLPSIFPSNRVFSNESVLRIRWPKYWSFSFSISPSSEYSGLIPLGLTCSISLLPKGLSRKHQFFGTQSSSWSNLHICTWLLENYSFNYMDLCQQNDVSTFKYVVWVCHSFSSKELVSFNFVAAVTVHSDFGPRYWQENWVTGCNLFKEAELGSVEFLGYRQMALQSCLSPHTVPPLAWGIIGQ